MLEGEEKKKKKNRYIKIYGPPPFRFNVWFEIKTI